MTVGKGGQLVFDPATLDAAVGDTVTYQFFAKVRFSESSSASARAQEERPAAANPSSSQNHAVVQSSFTDPCHPLDGGFFSAFTPTASPDQASQTTFTITINRHSQADLGLLPANER